MRDDLTKRVQGLAAMTEADAEAEWARLGEKFGPTPSDLDGPGGARASDPSTSHAAAQDHAASGNARRHRELALTAIYQHSPRGLTAGELEDATGIDGIWKRASELQEEGLIEAPGHERPSPKSGRAGKVLVCTDAGVTLARALAAEAA